LKSILWVAFIIALLILLGLFFLVYSQNQSSRLYAVYGVLMAGVLLSFALLSLIKKKGFLRKEVVLLALFFVVLCVIEVTATLAFRNIIGLWHCDFYLTLNSRIYASHPYLVGTNKPNANVVDHSIDYHHDSLGWRPVYTKPGSSKLPLIAMLGSSTTYGVGVESKHSFPSYLQEELTGHYRILNMGVGGYSSVENLLQTALILPEYKPDIAVYTLGMNDARNARLRHISPDYANYHARTLRLSMGLCPYLSANAPAAIKFSMLMAEKAGLLMLCPGMNYSIERWKGEGINPKSLKLFERNVREIVVLCRSMGIIPVLVPEIVPGDALPATDVSGWFPFMDGPTVAVTVQLFNARLKATSQELNVPFVQKVMETSWSASDFRDGWHLNPAANRKLAGLVAEVIERVKGEGEAGLHTTYGTQEKGTGRN